MIWLRIPSIELFDEERNEFIHVREYELQLEHSLVSVSKWESKWKKPFLSKIDKTKEETLDYIHCMTINQHSYKIDYSLIPNDIMSKITEYIDDPMTATTFSQSDKKATNKDVITAEIIYYWMVAFNIPFECQRWHLNRLLTLINVCSIKNQPEKKMTKKERLAQQKSLNEARKAKLNTKG